MLQIIDLENNALFTQVSSEESATVNGGGPISGAFGSLIALGTNTFFNPLVGPQVQGALTLLTLSPFII